MENPKETLNFRQASNRRKSEALNETQTRSEQDDGLQVQIDTLADTTMRQMTENLAVRRRIINDISNIKQTLNDIYDALVADAAEAFFQSASAGNLHFTGHHLCQFSNALSQSLAMGDYHNSNQTDFSPLSKLSHKSILLHLYIYYLTCPAAFPACLLITYP